MIGEVSRYVGLDNERAVGFALHRVGRFVNDGAGISKPLTADVEGIAGRNGGWVFGQTNQLLVIDLKTPLSMGFSSQ